MDEERNAFITGVVIATLILMVCLMGYKTYYTKMCAKKHNIYSCEWVVVPIKPKSK